MKEFTLTLEDGIHRPETYTLTDGEAGWGYNIHDPAEMEQLIGDILAALGRERVTHSD